jgi:DNA-binding NtrC family response regulator
MQCLKIILVDDDEDLRAVLAEGLEDLGHRVSVAGDGQQALALLDDEDAKEPDVAIVDFAMPDINGATLAKQITERLPDLPIIFVSGYADIDVIKNAVGSHARILQKPFDLDVLMGEIRECAVTERRNANFSDRSD